jgi:hypothetical protein
VSADGVRNTRHERRSRQPVSDSSRRSWRHKRQANHRHETAKPKRAMTTTQATLCNMLVISTVSNFKGQGHAQFGQMDEGVKSLRRELTLSLQPGARSRLAETAKLTSRSLRRGHVDVEVAGQRQSSWFCRAASFGRRRLQPQPRGTGLGALIGYPGSEVPDDRAIGTAGTAALRRELISDRGRGHWVTLRRGR